MKWRERDPQAWRRVTVQRRRTQWAVFIPLAGICLTWLLWPVWGSGSTPNIDQAEAEALWVIPALICGLTLLAIATWVDDGRRPETLAVVALLLALDTGLRLVLSPRMGGFEFVWMLPLVAGATRGAPVGFLMGGWAALLTTLVAGTVGTPLAMQMVVWALVGASGGLIHPVRTSVAQWLAVPLALGCGVVAGLLLNLPGWSWSTGVAGASTADFVPGLPPLEVMRRWWEHSWATSFALDLTRGLMTALGVAVLGRRLLTALRDTPDTWSVTTRRDTHQVSPTALARRERVPGPERIWN